MSINIPVGDFVSVYQNYCINHKKKCKDSVIPIHKMVGRAYKVLTTNERELWEWLKSDQSNPPSNTPMILWKNKNVEKISSLFVDEKGTRIGNILTDGLSIRVLQFIARKGWNNYVALSIKPLEPK